MDNNESPADVNVGRRDLLKMTAATAATAAAATVITTKKSQAQPVPIILVAPSPYLEPWVDPLPIMPVKAAVSALSPVPTKTAQTTGTGANKEVGRDPHQAWGYTPKKFYEVTVKEGKHKFHRDLPWETIWGYDGRFPGPTFKAKYGEPILARFRNKLPSNSVGPGSPEISVHLHNLHTPSESDGYPLDYFSATQAGPGLTPGAFKDHHYPMVCAGIDTYGGYGDPREALGTMWYHDHRVDFTAPNVYRGLCGFFLAYDAIDSGNETHASPALGLPSGAYDVPLVLNNVHFDATSGRLVFDQFNNDGFIGDKTAVNGKVQPFLNVAGRKYRFRFLNGSTARFYDLQLFSSMGFNQGFTYIANDGNLLPYPLRNRTSVRIAPAERGEIVIDFSAYPEGTELFLTNRMLHEDGRGPTEGKFVSPATEILKFIVGPQRNDPSRVPDVLRELPALPSLVGLPTRTFTFNRSGGMWTINERLFDNTSRASPAKGATEIWVLRNENDGWQHPVHIHFEEGRILSRKSLETGRTVQPPAHERGRKDVYNVGELEEVRVLMRFRDFTGKYVMHCHNLTHEDHGMMMRFDIV